MILNLFSVSNNNIPYLASFIVVYTFYVQIFEYIFLLEKNKHQKRTKKKNTSQLVLNIPGIDIKILSLVFTLEPDLKKWEILLQITVSKMLLFQPGTSEGHNNVLRNLFINSSWASNQLWFSSSGMRHIKLLFKDAVQVIMKNKKV